MRVLVRGLVGVLPVLALGLTASPTAWGTIERADDGVRPSPEQLDTFVRERMDAAGVPGVAYAVVGPTGIVHSATFGTDGDGDPITRSTPFLWGSVSKPVTATLVMTMVESGELRLDEPVTTYLPEFRPGDQEASDEITIRQLLQHTSGLPEALELTDRFDEGREASDVLPELADRKLVNEPGSEHNYSSVNYLVLAAVIEEVTNASFADVLGERVLEPAGMDDAITSSELADAALPPGHRYVFGQAVAFDSPYDPAGASYGYLGGSLADLAAFARAYLGESTILTQRRREIMVQSGVRTDDDHSYGLGWRHWTVEEHPPMTWHGGAVAGYFTAVIVLPEKDRALVVLCNSYGTFQESQLLDIGFGLADMMYGTEPNVSGTNTAYWLSLGGLGALGLFLLALTVLSIRRLVRPVSGVRSGIRRGLGLAAWMIGLLILIYGLAFVLPASFGVRLDQIVLWTPDIAWLTYASIALAGLLLVLRIAFAARVYWTAR